MKQVLIILHDQDNPEGYVGKLLQQHGISTDVIHVEKEAVPDPGQYAAVIAFGGIQHVYEDDKHPYFAPLKERLRQIVEQNIPFLGLCLAGQLLANALGGEVKRHTISEIGFFNIALTEEGKRDPLFAGLPGYQKVFHWHEDIFELPQGAILLATNERVPNQAFRYGAHAYGLQYHIELDQAMLDNWLHQSDQENAIADAPIFQKIMSKYEFDFPIYHAHTCIMLENFLRISKLALVHSQETFSGMGESGETPIRFK
jgi:GMP synthase-like glutamine amidotransferase